MPKLRNNEANTRLKYTFTMMGDSKYIGHKGNKYGENLERLVHTKHFFGHFLKMLSEHDMYYQRDVCDVL